MEERSTTTRAAAPAATGRAAGRVLFVPVSGGDGSGELQRCRLLADALHAASPGLQPHFLLAPGAPGVPWPATRLAGPPTRAVAGVVEAVAALRPSVVVFDGNARVAALAAARRAGARTVLISSRPSARRRGFRLRRMARLDEHWLVGADLAPARCWREHLAALACRRVAVRRFATLFTPPQPAAGLLQRLGLARPFVVACPGSGRHAVDGRTSADVFGEAAAALAAAGVATVAVGAVAPPPARSAGDLANGELMGLLEQAEAALLGGGSLLVQALALGVPVVAVPLQGEQAARVRWLADRGAVAALPAGEPGAMAASVADLVRDGARRRALRAAAASLGLRNGLPEAVQALARLARAPGTLPAAAPPAPAPNAQEPTPARWPPLP